MKIMIKMILTAEESISLNYLESFEMLIQFFVNFKKINIEKEILDNVSQMGAYGKNSQSRRYSVYFCSSIIRICTNPISDLFSRLLILSSDIDRNIRSEFAYHVKFICRDLEESAVRKNIYKIVRNLKNNLLIFLLA
jgi:hypothetical protein